MADEILHLTTPGEILLEEFLKPLNISQRELAKGLGIPEIKRTVRPFKKPEPSVA